MMHDACLEFFGVTERLQNIIYSMIINVINPLTTSEDYKALNPASPFIQYNTYRDRGHDASPEDAYLLIEFFGPPDAIKSAVEYIDKRLTEEKVFYRQHKCYVSTGIDDSTTFGSGDLDAYGFWEHPCSECARLSEKVEGLKPGTHWPPQ